MTTMHEDELPPYGSDAPEPVEAPATPSVLPTGPDERSMLGGMPKWMLWVVIGGLVLVLAVVAGALSGNLPGLGGADETQAAEEADADDKASEAVQGEPGAETTGTVCVPEANVRTGPGTDHDIAMTLSTGDEVLYQAVDGAEGWVQLVGTESWLAAELLCQD